MAEAATGLVLSAVQTLLTALQTKQLGQLCSIFGYESQLQKLHHTVTTIKANLLDVESKQQELTKGGQDWVEKLKDVVYDVDEFTTVAQQTKGVPGGKIYKKVCRFFSRNNHLLFSLNKSIEIKKLREKLDGLAKDRVQFGLRDVYEPVKRREETSSYVYEHAAIGREDDKERVIGMLLKDSCSSNQILSFVTIVGIGGLGKTTLAQLVYNDTRIREAFVMRLWVCVSEDFGMKQILGKMLQSLTGQNSGDLEFDVLCTKVQEYIQGKRYLLVLDDVWNESRNEWLKLREFLISGGKGSRILVTSRSKNVGRAINKDAIYELQGLSEIYSWHLFKTVAFAQLEDEADSDLDEIGRDIVKKCANVPLSIRVIGSLLYDKDRSHWLWFRSIDFAEMVQGEERIMSTLMFSYFHLTPELKSCFSFCSLFPKNYVIRKKVLISLWLAQGFLITTDKARSMEDIGEDYFTILLNRCFFQDIKLDKKGDVFSCKMHDVIHDLAKKVAGKESMIVTAGANNSAGKIRHLSVAAADACVTNWIQSSHCSSDTLRTLFQLKLYKFSNLAGDVASIFLDCKRLRILDLNDLAIKALPNTLGKLVHLRYLDLSYNRKLEMLPKSISKLHNLQILKLCGCKKLKELPEDMSKLVNLRTLDIYQCDRLTHMPKGMSNLKNLHTLARFVVGGIDSRQLQGSKLSELEALKSLRGNLRIRILDFSSKNMPCSTKGVFILKDAHLMNLEIICGYPYVQDDQSDQIYVHENLLEGLCPNHDISRIVMMRYQGFKLPSWASMMVSVKLSDLHGLQHLTSLSQFCQLKILELEKMPNIEYIESDAAFTLASSTKKSSIFFPVLIKLVLYEMPNLKGWWKGLTWSELEAGGGSLVDVSGTDIDSMLLPSFPCLQELHIRNCKSMTYIPPCPNLKQLHLTCVNEALTYGMKGRAFPSEVMCAATATSMSSLLSCNVSASCLKELNIDEVVIFNSLFKEFVGGAVIIQIHGFSDVESMGIAREGFQRCSSSLRHLAILKCFRLKSVSDIVKCLTNLQSLEINCCHECDLNEAEEDGMPWKFLHSLSFLELIELPRLITLPKGFQYLTSLRSLKIERCDELEDLGDCVGFLTSLQYLIIGNCRNLKTLSEHLQSLTSLQFLHINNCLNLKSLPEAMLHLSSLTSLRITYACNELRERCRRPDGDDWSKICNIPNSHIR